MSLNRKGGNSLEGIILRGVGGFYTAMTEAGEQHTLRAQGKIRRQRLTPMVGDRVEFTESRGEEHGWLAAILPRKNELLRPPVANIDVVVLEVAAASPQPDLLLLDRMLLCAREAGIEPMLAVNKCDLDPDVARSIANQYRGADLPVILLSAATGEGIERLRALLTGKVHAFAGQSGVGKSTLINALYGMSLQTGRVSSKIERGKHTTRHCELIPAPGGGMVLDTPGFSLLELALRDPLELQTWMPEFGEHTGCYFSPCAHVSEPNCAVRAAVDEGAVDRERYERYTALYEEMNTRWRERYG